MSGTVDAYRRDGYQLLGTVISGPALESARANLDRLIASRHPNIGSDEIYSAHQQERWLLEIAASAPLLDAIEAQIGPDIVLWSTHLICKPPRTGRAIPWHQDRPDGSAVAARQFSA